MQHREHAGVAASAEIWPPILASIPFKCTLLAEFALFKLAF
jgi:hypothetical protein